MRLVKVKPEHLDEFIRLEKEFIKYNQNLKIDLLYGIQTSEKIKKSYFIKELKERLSKKQLFFYFAEEKGEYLGYVYGYIQTLPKLFSLKKVGYLDGIIVRKKHRGKKVATFLKNNFFGWLKKKNIKLCQIHVAAKNIPSYKIYKNWGFEVDQYRLTKKI